MVNLTNLDPPILPVLGGTEFTPGDFSLGVKGATKNDDLPATVEYSEESGNLILARAEKSQPPNVAKGYQPYWDAYIFLSDTYRDYFKYHPPGAWKQNVSGEAIFMTGSRPLNDMFVSYPPVIDDEAPVHSKKPRPIDHQNWREAMKTSLGANFGLPQWVGKIMEDLGWINSPKDVTPRRLAGAMLNHYLGNTGRPAYFPLAALKDEQWPAIPESFRDEDRKAYEDALKKSVAHYFAMNPTVNEVTVQGPYILKRAQGADAFVATGSYWLGGAMVAKREKDADGGQKITGMMRMQGYDYYNFRLNPDGKPLPKVGGGTIAQSALVDLATHSIAKPFKVFFTEPAYKVDVPLH